MSKLSSLLKATMSEGIQLFNYRAKTERSRRLMPILLAVFTSILMLFSASALTETLREDGAESAVISIYALITAMIILMEGIYKSGDLLFKPRDNDALLAMPIKKSLIVAVRIIKFYVFELLYCLIFLLPAMIAYAINVGVEPSYYLVAATALVLMPIIPIAISCVIGVIISAVSARFKHKTFLQILLSFVSLFIFAIFILMMNTASDLDGAVKTAMIDKAASLYYPASALVKLATNFNLWQYIVFVMVHLAVLAVTIAVISQSYFQIVNRLSTIKRSSINHGVYHFTKRSQASAMVRKELTKYFSTPVLLMNTAIGLVLYLVATGALCIKYDDFVGSLFSSTEDFPLTAEAIHSLMPSVAFGLVAFASLMTFITVTMLSLEGRAFNQLKSMPISGIKVIMTKVLAAMLLIVPVTAIGTIIMMIRFQFGLVESLLVLVAVVAIPLVTELIGILIDLKYAKFDAESDAVVVKQSAGVLVATFLGLGMVLFTISLLFALVFITGQTVGLLIMDAIFVIVSLFLYFAVATRGAEKYAKLMA